MLICVPEKHVLDPENSYVYRSHPFGRACHHYNEDQNTSSDKTILDLLQKTPQPKNVQWQCPHSSQKRTDFKGEVSYRDSGETVPQYRILAKGLAEDEEAHVFCTHPYDQATKKQLKTLLKKGLKEARSIEKNKTHKLS